MNIKHLLLGVADPCRDTAARRAAQRALSRHANPGTILDHSDVVYLDGIGTGL